MTTIDKTDASDAAPVPPEVVVETVARAIHDADDDAGICDYSWPCARAHRYRRLAAAAIAAMPTSRAASTRAMRAVADNLDYYASKTTGGTHASGLEDAAAQIRAALASPAPAPQGEEDIGDTCCGRCPGSSCYVDQVTGA